MAFNIPDIRSTNYPYHSEEFNRAVARELEFISDRKFRPTSNFYEICRSHLDIFLSDMWPYLSTIYRALCNSDLNGANQYAALHSMVIALNVNLLENELDIWIVDQRPFIDQIKRLVALRHTRKYTTLEIEEIAGMIRNLEKIKLHVRVFLATVKTICANFTMPQKCYIHRENFNYRLRLNLVERNTYACNKMQSYLEHCLSLHQALYSGVVSDQIAQQEVIQID